jgi:hypothetical protein
MGKLEDNKDKMLDLFYNKYYSMNMISKELGVSRQAVQQVFKLWGVETATSQAAWVEVQCEYCRRKYKIPRSVARKKLEGGLRNFCDTECWKKWFRKQMS